MGEIKSVIMTLIIFSGVIIGITTFYGDLGTRYDVNATSFAFLNKSKQVAAIVEDIHNRTAKSPTGLEIAGFIAFGAIDTVKLAFTSIDTVSQLAGDTIDSNALGQDIQIPPWVGVIVGGLIIVIIMFTLISAWLKWDL